MGQPSIKEVHNYHQQRARGTKDASERQIHQQYMEALKPFLPPQLCVVCRGSGFQQLNDSDACDIVPCECQRS